MEQELSQAATAAYSKRSSIRSLFADPVQALGLLLACAPIFSGLIFRTYSYHVTPGWYEALRQMDMPFILVEMGVIFWAHARGLSFRKIFDALDRPARYALLAFLATFWISSAFVAPVPGYSILRASYWLVHIGFGFAVYHLARQLDAGGMDHFARAIICGLIAFVPLLALHFALAPQPEQVLDGKIIWSSAVPGMLSVRHLGMWSAAALGLSLGLLWTANNAAERLGWIGASIALCSAVLLWSGTRGGVAGVASALVVTAIMARSLPSAKASGVAVIAMIAGIWLSTFELPPDSSFGVFGAFSREFDSAAAYSGGRAELWTAMISEFARHPLFGVGEGSIFWLNSVGLERHVQPHNAIVQFLSSWGLVACVPALYLSLRLWWTAHKPANTSVSVIPALLMTNSLLAMAMVDGALYFSRFIMLIAAGFALSMVVANRAR